jgi:PrtD family type I secretion system ABC transporter
MTKEEQTTARTTTPAVNGQGLLKGAWRKSRPGLSVVALFSVFINVLKLAMPLYVLNVLDRVISSGSLETLAMLTAITLIAVVCGVLLEVNRRRLFIAWGNWIENLLGPHLFKAGLRQESGKVNSSGALRDLSTIKSFVSGPSLIAWLDVIWAPLFIVVVYLVAPQLSYIVIIACLIALALGTANELFTRDSRNETYKAGKSNSALLSLTERDPEAAGSLNQQNGLAELWSRNASVQSREGMRTRVANINLSAALQLVGRLVRIGVFGMGIWLVIDGALSIGAVITANVLGRMAFSVVSSAMLKWRDLVLAKRAYRQIKSILRRDIVSQVSLPDNISRPSLEFNDVTYRYSSQPASVFRRITVSIYPGEMLCLLGPAASGKTTFCRLASGIIPARSGKILFGEVDIYHLQQSNPEREIGYLPQEHTLFEGSVAENIAGMADIDKKMIVRAARIVGIHGTILKLPKGYDTEISDNEPLLSVGQRKAIAIARAFYGFPNLVVLDEPFANLDIELQYSLVQGLKKMRRNGGIVVMSTQYLQLANLADKVVAFKNGRHFLLNSAQELEEFQNMTYRDSPHLKTNDRQSMRGQSASKIKALRSF